MTRDVAALDLVMLWHHHQPDYRDPKDGRSLLPWVRLHGTKDYLDMALWLERHPTIASTFNFVPSLLDQIDHALGGGRDALFDLLARPLADLSPEERRTVASRCAIAPRHALERWPAYRRLRERAATARQTNGAAGDLSDDELAALEIWFLIAWIDPLLHDEPEAKAALVGATRPSPDLGLRDDLLGLHGRLLARVVPAYRTLAERGQIELSASPYYHPILPLVIDVQSARRARPDFPLPVEPFASADDARRQIERALLRHEAAFGAKPAGMWPSEGSVSPETVELAARAGVRWMASDEGVLWASLGEGVRREALYRPWAHAASADVALFFRDHELSDRIGFVYQHWDPVHAVDDFLERLRRIAREHAGERPPVVSVILDGENCWEHYADDGGVFLDRLYTALEREPGIRTRTPSQVLAERRPIEVMKHLHSGSWINADFHIWIGHPEKNRAWDLLARARRMMVEREVLDAAAWESFMAAEGSDWFWWFGDDHFTADKAIFDGLFRDHLKAVYTRAGQPIPGWLEVPIAGLVARRAGELLPVRFVTPTLDGRRTGYYEWHSAGRVRLGAGGGSMHRTAGLCRDLFFGFDLASFYLRLDFTGEAPGADVDLAIEMMSPRHADVRVSGLIPGERAVTWGAGASEGTALVGAACCIGDILELGVPFASLGVARGEPVELIAHLIRDGRSIETVPGDRLVRFEVPDETFEAAMWSA